MNAKEYLSKIMDHEMAIRQRYQEIERLKIDACSAAAIDYERVRVDGGGTMDPPYIKAMDRWIELQKESEQIADELAKERHQIIGQIQGMDNVKSRKILYQRYVKGKSIGRIAEEEGYSYEHTSRMHSRALMEFEEKYLKQDGEA